MVFIDTNYFARFFLADVPDQHEEVKRLFEEGIKGNKKLFTSTIVIFEIYWLFISLYKKSKSEVIEILLKVMALSFIKFDEKDTFAKALKIYQNSNLDLEDCYNISFSKSRGMTKFATFDKKLLKILKNI